MIDERQRAVQFNAECSQFIGHCDAASSYAHCRWEVQTLKICIRSKECNSDLSGPVINYYARTITEDRMITVQADSTLSAATPVELYITMIRQRTFGSQSKSC